MMGGSSVSGGLTHVFGSHQLRVSVRADGAEPVSIRTAAGHELLWQAGPAWPRHAPVLFPIVGRLANDTLRHAGRVSRLTQHGFARDRRFTWLDRSADGCRLVLEDDAQSLAMFPFRFQLEIGYRVRQDTLTIEYRLHNPDDTLLPASIGAHPAFCWPLGAGIAREAHRLLFDQPEPAPIRRVEGGLLRMAPEPSPIDGRVLALSDALFADDAVILDRPTSRSLTYEADGAPVALTIAWHGMPQLGIWSKPNAAFLCIEPWCGMASPTGFDGDFTEKPFLMQLAPGETATMSWSVQVSNRPA